MDKMEYLLSKLNEYELKLQNNLGGHLMEKLNFKLSDNQKFDLLWSALNTEFDEEHGYVVSYALCDVYDDYAIAYSYENNQYMRVYYTKNEDDTISLGDMVECYIIDVTASEKAALEALQKLNNGNYEKVDEAFAAYQEVEEKVSEFEHKIEEQTEQISTLNMEKANLTSENELLTSNYTKLEEELAELKSYKLAKENQAKNTIIDKYAAQLDDEIITSYRERVEEFDEVSLEKELAYELVQSKPTIFSVQDQSQLVPQEEPATGLAAVLEKYRNNGGK
jgi:regulator of replication initiation timing